MRRVAVIPAAFLGLCLWLAPVASAPKPLQIYFIDVEGGQSTLIVDPQGESLLIDTGWDDFNGRDADRILVAVKSAGRVPGDRRRAPPTKPPARLWGV